MSAISPNTSLVVKLNGEESSLLIQPPKPLGWLAYITDFSISIIHEYWRRSQRPYNPLRERAQELFPSLDENRSILSYPEEKQPWLRSHSKILVVFIHGLNSSPLAFSNYLTEFLERTDGVHYFAPYVYKRGYCSLSEAVAPIMDVVQNYAYQYPNNTIILIGHSRGATIAARVEQKLKAKNIRLVSIAGPHYGSKIVEWAARWNLTERLGFTEQTIKEMTYQGDLVKGKLTKWQEAQKKYCEDGKQVKRFFFAATCDMRVYPMETCFPDLPDSTYYQVRRESHESIVDGVREQVMAYIKAEI